MEKNEARLTLDSLIGVFSFLDEETLLKASCVCKDWHRAAETQCLWRQMCLQRWGFCNVAQLLADTHSYTWKRYYLHRAALELKMMSGRSGGDYSCKSLRGHTDRIVGFSYLKGNSALQDMCSVTPVVCSACADGTLKAWDLHKGVSLWSTSTQNPLTCVITDPEQDVVITADSGGMVSTWSGGTGEPLSSFCCGSSHCTIITVNTNGNTYIAVGTALGSLLVLVSPQLCEVRRCLVFDSFSLNLLRVSPDKKWIFTASTHTDSSPKVFSTESVCGAVEDTEAVCVMLPVSGCSAAEFFPCVSARLSVVHRASASPHHRHVSVFDLSLRKSRHRTEGQAQQVDRFRPDLSAEHSDPLLGTKGSSVILLADGAELKVYSIKGQLISSFKEHLQPITSVCVDDFRVVTASRDLSLRVLTWRKDGERGGALESRYQLLGGSHNSSRGFTAVQCDYGSVVASVECVNGRDVLKAYVFSV